MGVEQGSLIGAWENFSVPLWIRDGFDERRYEELVESLQLCAREWKDRSELPRTAVNVLVDIVSAMEATLPLYSGTEAARITEATYELQALVWNCVAVA